MKQERNVEEMEKRERVLRCRSLYRNSFVPVRRAISVG